MTTHPTPEEIEAAYKFLRAQLDNDKNDNYDGIYVGKQRLASLLSAVEQAQGMRRALEWMPFETAPKGPSIDLLCENSGYEPLSIMGPFSIDDEGGIWDDQTGEKIEDFWMGTPKYWRQHILPSALSSLPPDPLLVEARADKSYCVGYLAGWNAGMDGNEKQLASIQTRLAEANSVIYAATGEKQ